MISKGAVSVGGIFGHAHAQGYLNTRSREKTREVGRSGEIVRDRAEKGRRRRCSAPDRFLQTAINAPSPAE